MTYQLQTLLRNTRLLNQREIWISPGWGVPTVIEEKELVLLLYGLSFLGCNLEWEGSKQIIADNRNVRNVHKSGQSRECGGFYF